jgi:paraquat-inducible protein B
VGLATGLLYVELDFEDPRTYPADARLTDVKYAVVPAMPSAISEFQQSLQEIVTDLKKVDFVGLANAATALLTTANTKMAELNTKAMSDKVGQAADAVRALAESPDAKAAVANFNGAVTELRGVLGRLDTQVGANGTELAKTLQQAQTMVQSFNAAALTVRRLAGEQSGLGEEAARALKQMGEAADSVQRLADFLERNPNAMIAGKKRPE